MIDLKQAIVVAKEKRPYYVLTKCKDIGSEFVFYFREKDGRLPPPGTPHICVDKENGEISYIGVPPFENLEILENGKIIDLD